MRTNGESPWHSQRRALQVSMQADASVESGVLLQTVCTVSPLAALRCRLLRNRVSAQQARERKKSYVATLEEKCKTQEQRLAEAEQRIKTLERENVMLRSVMKNMQVGACRFFWQVNELHLGKTFHGECETLILLRHVTQTTCMRVLLWQAFPMLFWPPRCSRVVLRITTNPHMTVDSRLVCQLCKASVVTMVWSLRIVDHHPTLNCRATRRWAMGTGSMTSGPRQQCHGLAAGFDNDGWGAVWD